MLTVLLWFPLYGAIFPLPLLDCSFHNIGSFYGYESEIKGEKMEFIFYGKNITQFDESLYRGILVALMRGSLKYSLNRLKTE